MDFSNDTSLQVFAPAKVNLYLHITGRRTDGYHLLDSLFAFCADIGDEIIAAPDHHFSFHVDGPYAAALPEADAFPDKNSSNLVVRAALSFAKLVERPPDFRLMLRKNLPVAAGLGGGSADAAATLKALCRLWGICEDRDDLLAFCLSLGADVPACFFGKPVRVQGIGEILEPAPLPEGLGIVLVNPCAACSTPEVFKKWRSLNTSFRPALSSVAKAGTKDDVIAFLKAQHNDLEEAALFQVPVIQHVLDALGRIDTCRLARLSGSGASCFALFDTREDAMRVETALKNAYPSWWVKAGALCGYSPPS